VLSLLAGAVSSARAQHEHPDVSPAAYPPRGSGTTWLPTASPMAAWHLSAGGWRVMIHGNAFLQYVDESGPRGNYQLGSVTWVMADVEHGLAGGTIGLSLMTSAEVLTLTRYGYPQLLQVAQPYGSRIVTDRMHPHEVFSEVAVRYDHALAGSLRAFGYVAAVGEPALGPVAYLHRPATISEPAAPLGHHSQDVTHESFGVATIGVFTRRWRLEGSLFNGAHPDDVRTNIELGGARINATAGRLTVNPGAHWSIAAYGAYLPRTSGAHAHGAVHRLGAAAMYVKPRAAGTWATTLIWGANVPTTTGRAQHSWLVETNLDLTQRDAVFGRLEYVTRTSEELDLVGSVSETVKVGALRLGYARKVFSRNGFAARVGIRGNAAGLPEQLRIFYGSRMPLGVTTYLQVRPAP
jgi:hypothetical protein